MGPPSAAEEADERYDDDELQEVSAETKPEAIFTCKFPGCTRQYASTDGVRKHCRKSHPDWLREVDLEKASTGCRWAAYCTREPTGEGVDPRSPTVGAKRARDMLAAGGLPPATKAAAASTLLPGGAPRLGGGGGGGSGLPAGSTHDAKPTRPAPLGLAMDGKSALRAPRPPPRATRENAMPPDMISLPGEALLAGMQPPGGGSALTPNAHARWRLGEIADNESFALQHGGTWAALPSSPLCDFANAPLPKEGGFFVQWAMPPLKRNVSKDALPRPVSDTSLNTTVGASLGATEQAGVSSPYADDDSSSNQHDSPATFLESVLA